MHPDSLRRLLQQVKDGEVSPEAAIEKLERLPFEATSDAMLDHHRQLRCGFPEVIFAPGKSADQILAIAGGILKSGQTLLVTRVEEPTARRLMEEYPGLEHNALAGTVSKRASLTEPMRGRLAVVAAGTADLPVAEEAAVTATLVGCRVERIFDVGVAGLHRLLAHLESLRRQDALVVVAGMEGALPSVVGGLVAAPVVAVPTSVGYGASFSGLAALLAMLNSCAAGVTVVNIDNGFGGGYAAAMMARGRDSRSEEAS
jgi:NCAIR mutase (PurE)-related protein